MEEANQESQQRVQDAVSSSLSILIDTADFACMKHKDQRRKDPEQSPYIIHPIGVANIISKEGCVNDLHVLQAAVLHDTVEDTDTTLDEIEERFGPKVRSIVAEVTDDKSLAKMERKRLQVVNAPHKSKEAKLVKLADKLYNLRSINQYIPQGWTEERATEYFKWAKQVIDGLRGTNDRLEAELDALFAERNIQ